VGRRTVENEYVCLAGMKLGAERSVKRLGVAMHMTARVREGGGTRGLCSVLTRAGA